MASAGSSGGWDELAAILLSYWWLFLLFGGAILEWIGETFNVGLRALCGYAEARHARKLEMLFLRLEAGQARRDAPVPGPCRHRRAKGVRDLNDNVVAWLCPDCDEQLPAGFSVYEEDL